MIPKGGCLVQTSSAILAVAQLTNARALALVGNCEAGAYELLFSFSTPGDGTIVPNRSSLSGSYQVNPDCSGDLALVLPVAPGVTATSTSHFVIVEHGKEICLVNTGAGRVLAGNARKIQK